MMNLATSLNISIMTMDDLAMSPLPEDFASAIAAHMNGARPEVGRVSLPARFSESVSESVKPRSQSG